MVSQAERLLAEFKARGTLPQERPPDHRSEKAPAVAATGASEEIEKDADQIVSDDEFAVTTFNSKTDTNGTERRLAWLALVEMLADPPVHADKLDCPLFRASLGGRAAGSSIAQVSLLVGDYDGEAVAPAEAAQRLRAAGVQSLVYTTASHGAGAPRWRVVAPLVRAVAPEGAGTLLNWLNGALGGILAPESWESSRCWFYGRVDEVPFEAHEVDGLTIDVVALAPDFDPIPSSRAAAVTDRPDCEEAQLERTIVLDRVDDETIEHVRSALGAFSDAMVDEYHCWTRQGQALKSLEQAGRADEARTLWHEWSARSSRYNRDEADDKWSSFKPSRITYRSIFDEAAQFGWVNPRSAEGRKAAALLTFEQIRAAIESDQGGEAMHLVERVVLDISNAHMTGVQEELLLKALKAKTKVRLASLREELTKAKVKASGADDDPEYGETHATYSKRLLLELAAEGGGHQPVGVEGRIYTLGSDGVWRGRHADEYEVRVGEKFSGLPHCTRRSDYTSIAKHAYAIAGQGHEGFFADAPGGLACPDGTFFRLQPDGELVREALTADHRQRFVISTTPADVPTPMFDRLLDQTFASEIPGECEAQIALLQEIMGAIAMGLMAKHEKVAKFYGPGRAGKGTVLKIIEELVPANWRTAVSPFCWDSEYYIAFLAGARLNVVGELPDDRPIPAADFKTVTGRDLLTGRDPGGRPFTFRNEAAHVFNTNYLISTRDHSDAFFSRWLLVVFRNSRLGAGDGSIDADLAKKIISTELPGVLWWALKGAQRLVKRGYFQATRSHAEMMDKWRRRTDTVLEFLHDPESCSLDASAPPVRRRDLYERYAAWCIDSGRKPMGKQKVFELLDSPAVSALGVRVRRDSVQREVVDGLRLHAGYASTLDDANDGF